MGVQGRRTYEWHRKWDYHLKHWDGNLNVRPKPHDKLLCLKLALEHRTQIGL